MNNKIFNKVLIKGGFLAVLFGSLYAHGQFKEIKEKKPKETQQLVGEIKNPSVSKVVAKLVNRPIKLSLNLKDFTYVLDFPNSFPNQYGDFDQKTVTFDDGKAAMKSFAKTVIEGFDNPDFVEKKFKIRTQILYIKYYGKIPNRSVSLRFHSNFNENVIDGEVPMLHKNEAITLFGSLNESK